MFIGFHPPAGKMKRRLMGIGNGASRRSACVLHTAAAEQQRQAQLFPAALLTGTGPTTPRFPLATAFDRKFA
jgi:hypothetical protein